MAKLAPTFPDFQTRSRIYPVVTIQRTMLLIIFKHTLVPSIPSLHARNKKKHDFLVYKDAWATIKQPKPIWASYQPALLTAPVTARMPAEQLTLASLTGTSTMCASSTTITSGIFGCY